MVEKSVTAFVTDTIPHHDGQTDRNNRTMSCSAMLTRDKTALHDSDRVFAYLSQTIRVVVQ